MEHSALNVNENVVVETKLQLHVIMLMGGVSAVQVTEELPVTNVCNFLTTIILSWACILSPVNTAQTNPGSTRVKTNLGEFLSCKHY